MINILILDLAGNLVVKNPPADAGDMGQLSPCTTITEPAHLEPVLHNNRSHCNEKPVPC